MVVMAAAVATFLIVYNVKVVLYENMARVVFSPIC